MSACVEVTDKDGQTVGTVTAKEFGAWRKNLGGNVAFLWAGGGGDVIVDSRGAMEELPPRRAPRGATETQAHSEGGATTAWRLRPVGGSLSPETRATANARRMLKHVVVPLHALAGGCRVLLAGRTRRLTGEFCSGRVRRVCAPVEAVAHGRRRPEQRRRPRRQRDAAPIAAAALACHKHC